MRIELKQKQREFLNQLQKMNEIKVLKLKSYDRRLINSVLDMSYYYENERTNLNRLLKRWHEPRPNANLNEYY